MLPDRSDREKLYMQLTDIFLANIRSGVWRAGEQIPTEEELCREFNVSKITIRRAIQNLVIEGYLERIQGKGTFARQGPPRSGILMKTTLMESVFLPGDTENIKVIEKKVLHSLEEPVMKRLGPVIDRDIFYLSRLKSSEGVPVMVNEIYVPLRVCPALKDWNPEEGPVFDFLKERSTVKIVKVTQSVEVGRPGEYLAGLLNARASSSFMIIHRLFMASGDVTVAYSRTTARGDRFHLDTEYVRIS